VHRDIKPENVFLAKDELGRCEPKLVDFGVARLREGGTRLTRPGALMGTPDYMAPEQAQAEPDVDHRADIWAFAVVLYELMTLRRPFSQGAQQSYLMILRAIVSEPPEDIAQFGVAEPELWVILQRALAKRREQRFQSMRELGDALAAWLLEKGIGEDAYGSSLRARWLVGEGAQASAAEFESITVRRASPKQTDEDGLTLPPPATATPEVHSDAVDPPRAALPRQGPRQSLVRFGRTSLGTLASSPLRRLSPFKLALLAAFVAALITAGLMCATAAYFKFR
jgi:serine/threonine-protein kinase